MQAIEAQQQNPIVRRVFFLLLPLALLAIGMFLYWHMQSTVTFQGLLKENLTLLAATSNGVVTRIEILPGQRAQRGQILLRLDDAPLQRILLDEQEKLDRLKQMLPLQHQGPGAGEALTARLERQRQEEAIALRQFQESSDREAEAAVLHNRVVLLSSRNAATPEQRASAEWSLDQARLEKEKARQNFEALSLARAATDKEINRIRNTLSSSGANTLPVETRLTMYRQQQERVALAAAALQSAVVNAPENGEVATVLVQPGQPVETGLPLLVFRPEGATATAMAHVPETISRRLKQGQPCRIRIGGESGKEVSGYIESLGPAGALPGREDVPLGSPGTSQPDLALVTVALLPGADETEKSLITGANESDVAITVLLREPLYNVPPARFQGPAPGGQVEAYQGTGLPGSVGQAAPPVPPLSVQSPFGQYPAQSDAQSADPASPGSATLGGPRVQGQTPPVLPPMQAPYPLTGSPLPDPRNNPSIVPETVLEPVAPQ